LGKSVTIECVDDPVGGHRCLARDRHAPPRRRGDFTGGVRIGIDREDAAKLQPAPQPAPVEIEPPGIAVDLDCHVVRRTGAQDGLDIDVVAGPAQQLPAGHVTDNIDKRIGGGAYEPLRLRLRSIRNWPWMLPMMRSKRRKTSSR
jgi:hypothetical protein